MNLRLVIAVAVVTFGMFCVGLYAAGLSVAWPRFDCSEACNDWRAQTSRWVQFDGPGRAPDRPARCDCFPILFPPLDKSRYTTSARQVIPPDLGDTEDVRQITDSIDKLQSCNESVFSTRLAGETQMVTDPRNGHIQVVASPDDMSFEFNPTSSTLRLFRPADPEPVKVVDVTLPVTPAAPRTVDDVVAAITSGTVFYFEDTRAGTLALKVGNDLYATCEIPRQQ